MTMERPAKESRKEIRCRVDMPSSIACDLDMVGGVNGLCERLPKLKNIMEISAIHNALSDPVRMTILYLLAIHQVPPHCE